jgi:Fe-S oxidoreductase
MLDQARKAMAANVAALAPRVSEAVPLIGVEPSALLGFRDEAPNLVPAPLRDHARTLAEYSLLIDEFLARSYEQGDIDPAWFTDTPRDVHLHGHCHQKALASLQSTVKALSIPANYTVHTIPSGCCGMAGSFGYEHEHYSLSLQIAELVLAPTVRGLPPDALLAAPGTSCRHQIAHTTGRTAAHPAEILYDALTAPNAKRRCPP